MKNLILITVVLLSAISSQAFATNVKATHAGDMDYFQGLPVQNLKSINATPSKSACTTTTATKGTIATFSVDDYRAAQYATVNPTTGAGIAVKRCLNTNTSCMPTPLGTGEVGLKKGVTSLVFQRYSGASATYQTCIDLQ
jgi:hypothetical protein